MNDTILTGIISLSGMFITGLFGFLVAKHNNKKDLAINDRQQLSKDEHQFRSEIYERMQILQEQVDKYQEQVEFYHQRSVQLEETVVLWKNKYVELDREWRTKYTETEIENKHLNNKIYVLEKRVQRDDPLGE